jgi:Protein of unknown function (DUF2911)
MACLFSLFQPGLNCRSGTGSCDVHLLKIIHMQTFSRLVAVVSTVLICSSAFSQDAKARISPARSVSGMIGPANVTIAYSSPAVRGRKIWGGLVHYDSVWRAGANEATTFETDKAIMVAGKPLPAGKYGFFLLPRETGSWTVIFNNVPNQWGAFKYDSTKDQLRVEVMPRQSADNTEALEYKIVAGGFGLNWEKMMLFIPVK